jgi:hypothetical protein
LGLREELLYINKIGDQNPLKTGTREAAEQVKRDTLQGSWQEVEYRPHFFLQPAVCHDVAFLPTKQIYDKLNQPNIIKINNEPQKIPPSKIYNNKHGK